MQRKQLTWLCTVLVNYSLKSRLISVEFLIFWLWMQYAGEVYGEKAILATETRELQSRLQCLSEERVKALASMNEV